jgi:hypothetical protein
MFEYLPIGLSRQENVDTSHMVICRSKTDTKHVRGNASVANSSYIPAASYFSKPLFLVVCFESFGLSWIGSLDLAGGVQFFSSIVIYAKAYFAVPSLGIYVRRLCGRSFQRWT